MWYLWLIFALVPVMIFASFYYVLSIAEKNTKINSQQKWKGIWRNTFHWVLLDLVYMAIFNQWKTWIFIFGSIVIIKVLYTVTKVFLQKEEKQPLIAYSIIFDFIIGVGLTVYLIFIIENEVLQSTITTIIAAVYGGLFTLVGVAWTIRRQDAIKKEEEIKKAKPLFTFIMQTVELENVVGKKVCFDEPQTVKRVGNVVAILQNSEQAVFSLSRVYYDNKWRELLGNVVVLPNTEVILDFSFANDANNIFLEVKDAIGNFYYYEIKVLCLYSIWETPPKGDRLAHTIREIKEITLEEIEKRIKITEQ